ncbi:MAG: putative motility protein [Lentisphaeraceae bacterium]|nr:putative motility protein [Lentisphaeraceae bacterium]
MEITGSPQDVMTMESAKTEMSADVAFLKKSMEIDKDMATQLLDAMPMVNHDAPAGQQVRMYA